MAKRNRTVSPKEVTIKVSMSESEGRLLNALIINQGRKSFCMHELVKTAQNAGYEDHDAIIAVRALYRKGLLKQIGDRYYVKPTVRRRRSIRKAAANKLAKAKLAG